MKNREGYADPTAFTAIRNLEGEAKRKRKEESRLNKRNAEKIEYLSRYKAAKESEENLIHMIEDMEAEISPKAITYSDMPKGGAKNKDLSDYVVRYEGLMKRLQQARIEKANVQMEIVDKIMQMKKPPTEKEEQLAMDKSLLYKRYIEGMKWEEIMEDMGYSWSHVHRVHGRALNNIDIKTG